MQQTRAVIFDLGGVLMTGGSPNDFAKRHPELDPEMVKELLMGPYHLDTDHPWHRVERGEITWTEMQAATRPALEAAGIVQPKLDGAIREPKAPRPAFGRNEPMIALLGDLRAAGIRLGMLTNNVAALRPAWWPLADWSTLFDDIVDSHEVGVRKPDPAIYHLSLRRLGVAASEALFLDDLIHNVNAAVAVGMVGIHVHNDGTDAIARVRELTGVAAAANG